MRAVDMAYCSLARVNAPVQEEGCASARRMPRTTHSGREAALQVTETEMGMVTIKCPITGQDVPTGIMMDHHEFERVALEHNVVRCRACGRIHTWCKENAQLRDDSPPAT